MFLSDISWPLFLPVLQFHYMFKKGSLGVKYPVNTYFQNDLYYTARLLILQSYYEHVYAATVTAKHCL